ncbi:MAG TPA: HAD family hydrolase [Candidatus Brocadiia bacterium]|nr:HAD family hydrolase [Candidatus Brocadiia bacterium]
MLRYPVVFFDFGGTLNHDPSGLLEPKPFWLGGALKLFLDAKGHESPRAEELDDLARETRLELRGRTPPGNSCQTKQEADDWHALWFRGVYVKLGITSQSEREFGDLVAAYRQAEMRSTLGVNDFNRSILRELSGMGCRMGIISNVDGYLSERLRIEGVHDRFFIVIESANIGVEKPNPIIFRRALAAAMEPPERCLHVGDSYDADVLGGRGVGMATAWLGRRDDIPPGLPHPDYFIESLGELPSICRLSRGDAAPLLRR